MQCTSCQAEIPKDSRFCDGCGAPRPVGCPSCGAANRAGARFCAACGSNLATGTSSVAPTPAGSAERRQLTVLFCDLAGSTALASRLDPEDLREVIAAYHRSVSETVTRFGGVVAKYMGDGVLVYFGYPQAHEDDPERAVRSGLALIETVRQLDVAHELQARVGIATGLVVVGDLVDEGDVRERSVVGETPNLAARLQSLAEPDSVVIAASTHRLLADIFEYQDLGAIEARGFAAPVRAWRVLREGAAESRFEARHSAGVAPLIGREEEIVALGRLWEQAKRGQGQAVLLSGEPGIGKSRICLAVQQRVAAQHHALRRYFCSPYRTDSALYPFVAQLERAAGFERADTAAAKLGKLEALLGRSLLREDQLAILAELLSIRPGDRVAPLDLSPRKTKERTLATLVAHLEAEARHAPVLMIFEDAHWIDPTSLDLLSLIVPRLRTMPVLMIVTFRPEFEPPWAGEPHVSRLALSRLGRRDGEALIGRVTGGKPMPAEIVKEIVARTDGVPLFIEELTKAVLESSLLRREDGGYALTGPLPPLAIPSTLQASLMARLDRLGPLKELAQIGAAVGREFTFRLVAGVAEMSPARLADALSQLEAAGLIFRQGTPPDATYTFKHALVQDAAHESLLRSRRSTLHAQIGALLERDWPDTVAAQPEVLARHFAEAGLPANAAVYWLRAGQHAIRRSANVEALAHLSRGLEALASLPLGPERTSLELDFRLGCASASIAAEGYAADSTERAYVRAHDLLRETGSDPRQYAVLYGLFVVRWNHAQLRDAIEVAGEFLDRALHSHDGGDPVAACVARRALAVGYNAMARFADAREQAAAAIELYDPEAHRSSAVQYGHDIGVAALMHRAVAELFLGLPAAARRAAAEAASLAARLGHANTTGYAAMWRAFLDLAARDMAAAAVSAERLLRVGEDGGMPQWAAFGRGMLGGVLAASATEPAAGLELVASGLAACERARIRILRPVFLCLEAEGLGRVGRIEEALAAVSDALRTAEATEERWWDAELLRQRALLSLHLARSREHAERDLRSAMSAAERQGARLLRLRAATSLARLWSEQRRRAEAGDLLAPIYASFTEGGDAPDLKAAKAMLDAL